MKSRTPRKPSSGNSGGSISKAPLAIDIEDLTVQYRTNGRRALDGLTLSIETGSFFGLLGPNGAGKTTLISFLCGQVNGRFKRASVLGQNRTARLTYKRELGYAPQEIALYPTLSARANLEFFAKLQDVPLTEVDRVLGWIGLEARAKEPVEEFSGGMKRRLNLGVALLNRPKLLILDEPTAGVDPQSRNFIFDRILELKREGVTLIYSTHYLEEVKKLCDTVGVLRDGRLTALGERSKVLGEDQEKKYLDLTGWAVE